MVICLERGADLHMAQLMPLPLTVSCFGKIQICFTFLVPAHLGSPGQRAVKRMYVCMLGLCNRRINTGRWYLWCSCSVSFADICHVTGTAVFLLTCWSCCHCLVLIIFISWIIPLMANKVARTANYNYTENLMLLELVDKYRTAVENKKTDACTTKVRIDLYNRQPRSIVIV